MKKKNFKFFPGIRLPFSYGWIVLVVGTIGVIMSIPGQTMGVSVFTDFLIDSLQISRTGLSTTYLLGTILSALILSRGGRFYDRFGAKTTALIAAAAMTAVLFYMSYIDIIKDTISQWGIVSPQITAFILLTAGFFILRFFGQVILAMVSRNMVLKWFDRKRGLVVAIMSAFISFAFSLSPKLFNSMINIYNWNGTWRILALIVFPIFILIIILFFRDWKPNPVTEGLDSIKKEISYAKQEQNEPENRTLKEALKTKTFWSYNIAITLMSMFGTAFTFHIVSIFSYADMGRSIAVSVFIPISIIAVVISFTGSTLSDYISLKIILALELIGIITASFSLIFLAPGVPLVLLIAGMGIANGTFVVLINIAWVKTFGKLHLGAISGYAMGWTVGGSAIGPFIFSAFRDVSDNYKLAALFTILVAVLLLIFVFIKKEEIKG